MALGHTLDILLQDLILALLFLVRKHAFLSTSCVYQIVTTSNAMDDTVMDHSPVYSVCGMRTACTLI